MTVKTSTGSTNTHSHSVKLTTQAGPNLDVKIESRSNRNGFLDVNKRNGFKANAVMKGTPVNPKMATYTWTVHDELNQAFSNFTSFNDFMKIGSGLLQKNKQYTVKVVANYNNGAATGHAEIKYITDVDSDYSFNIEPATGVSLVDKFSFSTSS